MKQKALTQNTWTEEEIQLLKEKYPCTIKANILELFPRHTYVSIICKANSLNIKKLDEYKKYDTSKVKYVNWTKEELEIVKKYYPISSKKELEKLLPRHGYEQIKLKAKFFKLKKSDEAKERSRNENYRQYKIDPSNFFKTWSHDMAYILGFITTDGNVKKNRVMITQKGTEYDTLKKISIAMTGEDWVTRRVCINKNIHNEPRKYDEVCFWIDNKEIIKDLYNLGIHENKTFTVKPPENIPTKYFNSYLRGIIDGDGVNKKENKLELSISGNRYMMEFLLNFLNNFLGTKRNLVYPELYKESKKFCIISFSGYKLLKLIDYLYKDGNYLYMKRKYDICIKYIKICENKKQQRFLWRDDEINILSKFYYDTPQLELCKLLPGRSFKAICKKAKECGYSRKRIINKNK